MDLPPQGPHFLGGSGVRCHGSYVWERPAGLLPAGFSFYAEATNEDVAAEQLRQVPTILVDVPLVL